MKVRTRNKVFVYWTFLTMAFYLFVFTESKSSGSGGSGSGSGGGGRGGRSGGGRLGGKRGALAAAAAGGVAGSLGYAAYKNNHQNHESPHRFHSNPIDNLAFLSGGGASTEDDFDYKTQESTYYNRREGFGMSAFGLLALILGIIGGGTLLWYCYMIGVPLWHDRQRRNRNSNEDHPLQETPSTATPSP